MISSKSNLILILTIGCFLVSSKLLASEIIIIDSTNFKSFGFYFNNDYLINQLSVNFFDSTGNSYVIPAKKPLLITFTKGNWTSHPAIMHPGETYTVTYEDGEYIISNFSNNSNLSAIYDIEKNFGFTFPDFAGLQISKSTNLNYVYQQHNDKFKERIDFFNQYKKTVKLTPHDDQYIVSSLQFKYLTAILFPYFNRANTTEFPFSQIPEEYAKKIENEISEYTFHDSLLYIDMYRLFLWNYSRFLARESLGTELEFSTIFEIATSRFEGETKAFVSSMIIKKYENTYPVNFPEKLNYFLEDIPDGYYKNLVTKSSIINATKIFEKFGNEVLQDSSYKNISLQEILHQAKGKLVYLDFWASWCKPCLEEIPKSLSLAKELSHKDVSFIYISIDNDNDKWSRALENHFATSKNHFRLNPTSGLLKELAIQSVPRYMLLDKAGKVITLDAARPSDTRTIGTITRLLAN